MSREPDRAVLRAIAAGSCIVCGDRPCDPDHEQQMGVKGPDCECVPLCRACHDRKHSHGKLTFAAAYGEHSALLAADRARRERP